MSRKRKSTPGAVNQYLNGHAVKDVNGNAVALGNSAVADAFSNPLARVGWGVPSVENGAQYPMTRFTFQYWELQSLYRSSWIVAKVIDTIPDDMLKNGIEFEGLTLPERKKIEATIRSTRTISHMLNGLKWGRLFGGAACLMVIDGHEEILDKPLILDDVELDSYCGLIAFDRWSGIWPSGELVQDYRSPDFGLPEHYRVVTTTGKTFTLHHSRVLRFIGRNLPSWEKQVEQYWGISEVERLIQELKRYDNSIGSVIGLLMRANIFTIRYEELAQALSGVGMSQAALQNFYRMIQNMNDAISNQGLLVLPNEGGMENHTYSFSGIDNVLMCFRAQVSGAVEIPQTRLFGQTQTGLGQSNEGDEGIYYDSIKQKQTREVTPLIDKLLPVIAMSCLGNIPDDLNHHWPPNWIPTGQEKAKILKTNVDSIVMAAGAGLISTRRAMQELKDQSKETDVFGSITDNEIAAAPDKLLDPMEMAEAGAPEKGETHAP